MGKETFKNHAEQNPELQDFLQSFDHQILKGLFERAAEDAGQDKIVDLPDPNLVDEKTNRWGEYHENDKRISLNLSDIKRAAEAFGVDWQPLAQKLFIHENVHAFTDRGIQNGRIVNHGSLGYQETKRVKFTPLGVAFYKLWNEGCTELWARQLFREYQAESGNMSEGDADLFFQKLAEKKDTTMQDSYEDEVDLVKTFSKYLAKAHHLNPAVMEQSILEGMITGEMLTEADSLKVLESILPSNFLDDLKGTNFHKTAVRLTKELNSAMEKSELNSSGTDSFTRSLLRIAEGILESQGNAHS